MTVQVPDKIIIEGKTHELGTYHVQSSGIGNWEIITSIPLKHLPGIEVNDKARVGSTACWRGYVATWEIRKTDDEEHLYVVDLEGPHGEEGMYKMTNREGIKATWVSALLRCVVGGWYGSKGKSYRIKRGAHFTDTIYPKEIHCNIIRGKVVSKELIDNSGIVIWNDIMESSDTEILKYMGIHPMLDEVIEQRMKGGK